MKGLSARADLAPCVRWAASVTLNAATAWCDCYVTYRLMPAGDTWVANAITVEDVSLTANLGSQLNNLLSRMTVDDLLTLMRCKYGNAAGEA